MSSQVEICYQAWIRRSLVLLSDLEAAASTPAALMPSASPAIEGLEAFFVHRPLRIVTGDFCEILTDATGNALIAFGDASGKGASAAFYGTYAGSWLRVSSRSLADPFELLGQLDTALKELPAGSQYATILLVRWCPESSVLQICSGGSPPPILFRDGEPSQIELNGTPVGLPTLPAFSQKNLPVMPGDLLVFYSDGISDQTGPDGIRYGDEPLAQLVRQTGRDTPENIAAFLLADIRRHSGDVEQQEDQMLLLIRGWI